MTKEPWRDKVDRANKQGHTQYTLSRAGMCVPIDQNTMETTSITTTARRNVTNHSSQKRMEYIVTEHRAKMINKDQPSMEDIITTNTGEDVIK